MRIKLPAIFAVALLAATSFSSIAATEINRQQAQGLQSIGSVSVSSVNGSLDDATRQLSQKADGNSISGARSRDFCCAYGSAEYRGRCLTKGVKDKFFCC